MSFHLITFLSLAWLYVGSESFVSMDKKDIFFTNTKGYPPYFDSYEPRIEKRDVRKSVEQDIPVVNEATTPEESTIRPILRSQGKTAENNQNTTPSPISKGVTTFPKRPEADNKRIEFQRRSRIRPPVVKILDAKNFVYAHNGNFHYSYDSEDGTKISSEGKLLRNNMNEGAGEAVVGSVSYKDDEGNDYSLTYTADENGYRPVGDHLPTPPPIPPAIARALEILATKKPDIESDY